MGNIQLFNIDPPSSLLFQCLGITCITPIGADVAPYHLDSSRELMDNPLRPPQTRQIASSTIATYLPPRKIYIAGGILPSSLTRHAAF
ncbi:hypothetical protein LAD77_01755 [Klebsiella pneumoniae]|nr:hypothetical protein [Klebsiella pneumoniae]